MKELTWTEFLTKAEEGCYIKTCMVDLCEHNRKQKCILPSVNLNPQGKCMQLSLVTMKDKQRLLATEEKLRMRQERKDRRADTMRSFRDFISRKPKPPPGGMKV